MPQPPSSATERRRGWTTARTVHNALGHVLANGKQHAGEVRRLLARLLQQAEEWLLRNG
jgi:hypothetical protein